MAMNIKNAEVEQLAREVAALARESKTQAVRRALEERRDRLALAPETSRRGGRLLRFLQSEVWPLLPRKELGRALSRAREEAILGYGPEGV